MKPPIDTIYEQVEAERLLDEVLTRLNARVLGATLAGLCASGLFLATLILLLRGGPQVGKHLRLLGHFLPGYDVTWGGLLLSLPYGAAIGFVAGYLVSRVYNWVARPVSGPAGGL
ncbi:MAG: hypothetical protein JNL90_02220 [Planctomycetes bacterium]|nr:hypothetical protein [Planctomycetota bacterium]